ncbi:hypothetical protein AU190_20910 [Mycolicibacterium acapulense]|nr:hypothetical protein AU190_20910 [Mycolicibacterium acapulense]
MPRSPQRDGLQADDRVLFVRTDRLCARHGGRTRINATGRNGADLTLETADVVDDPRLARRRSRLSWP